MLGRHEQHGKPATSRRDTRVQARERLATVFAVGGGRGARIDADRGGGRLASVIACAWQLTAGAIDTGPHKHATSRSPHIRGRFVTEQQSARFFAACEHGVAGTRFEAA
jgi:hypothetical protein